MDDQAQATGRGSAEGRATPDLVGTWAHGPYATPTGPAMAMPDTPASAIPAEHLTLTLPGGTVVRAVDLDPDPGLVLPAFDVPADLTTAVIGFGGAAPFPDGAVADFGPGRLDFPLTVPAG